MEIILKTKKKKQHIKRDETRGGDGIIRIDGEACDVLEGILNQLESPMSVRELASVLIKEAANHAIIKEEE